MAHPVVKASLVDASEISYLIAFSPVKTESKDRINDIHAHCQIRPVADPRL